jgi:hypothetical protein
MKKVDAPLVCPSFYARMRRMARLEGAFPFLPG